MTPDTLNQWRADLGLSELAFAAYLGAPVNTIRNWTHGRRKPDASTLRLFDLLQRIERDAPLVHADLIREAQNGAPAAPAKRKRSDPAPVDTQVAQEPENAPEAVPEWLRIAV